MREKEQTKRVKKNKRNKKENKKEKEKLKAHLNVLRVVQVCGGALHVVRTLPH
jgi:hypothetical protein